jgi:hypothetical protein
MMNFKIYFMKKSTKGLIISAEIATLQLILKVKYWMYQEQANGNPTLQLILQIYDLITYSL